MNAPIELYTPNASAPDAWHRVTAPGGYEWWYFDAEDAQHDRQIVVILLEGFVFHPGYLRKYAAYVRRPTRHRPPVPRDFPCAYFVVYERGRIAHQFMLQYPAADFSAADDRLDVSIGPNHATVGDDGAIRLRLRGTPWKLTWQGPQFLEGTTLTGEFTFRPKFNHPPMERVFLSRAMTAADHHWVLSNPLCDVEGDFRVFDSDAPGEGLGVRFSGLGYHDHNYGTGPLGPGLKRWIWGRAAFDDAVYTFHHAIARNTALPPETHLVVADANGTHEIDVIHTAADWSARNGTMLAYPRSLSFDSTMRLFNPRLIDSAPFYMRLIYQSECRGRRGTAFCEVAYPHRLRWPVLGRMIEMSIGKG
jgi:carotenoid 1,2-hydratase